jgi:predicted dehydrogenase
LELTFYANGKYAISQDESTHFHGVSQGDTHTYEFSKPEPLLVEHQSFRDTIMGKPSTIVTLDDGIETLKVALTAAESYLSQNTKHL